MAGEQSRDEPIVDPTARFKCEVYFVVFDTLLTQLDERFSDFRNTITYFYCLEPSQLTNQNNDSFYSLCQIYQNDINVEGAIVEYETFKDIYASIRPSLPSDLQLGEVLPFLIVNKWHQVFLIYLFCIKYINSSCYFGNS